MTRLLMVAVIVTLSASCRREPPPQRPCNCPPAQPCPQRSPPEAGDAAALERVLEARRSIRTYTDEPVTRAEVEALVWAAQGVTLSPEEAGRIDGQGLRAAPSAGATYPLEIYVVADRVDGLEPGLYHYLPADNRLERVRAPAELAQPVAEAALDQRVVATAAALVVLAAVVERTEARYHDRAERYVMMELGHAAQNVLLMATARGLGGCPVGAFDDQALASVLELPDDQHPYYVLTVGRPRPPAEGE